MQNLHADAEISLDIHFAQGLTTVSTSNFIKMALIFHYMHKTRAVQFRRRSNLGIFPYMYTSQHTTKNYSL